MCQTKCWVRILRSLNKHAHNAHTHTTQIVMTNLLCPAGYDDWTSNFVTLYESNPTSCGNDLSCWDPVDYTPSICILNSLDQSEQCGDAVGNSQNVMDPDLLLCLAGVDGYKAADMCVLTNDMSSNFYTNQDNCNNDCKKKVTTPSKGEVMMPACSNPIEI